MRRTLTLVLLQISIFSSSWAASTDKPVNGINPAEVPVHALNVTDFVPQGWSIEISLEKDINGDGKSDQVLVLLENASASEVANEAASRSRALLVLLKMRKPGYRRVGLARHVFSCAKCYDEMAGFDDGNPKIRIVKRELIVEQFWDRQQSVQVRLRFRHDPRSGRMALIGEDVEVIDRAAGTRQTIKTNLLAGTRLAENDRFDLKKKRFVTVGKVNRNIPKSRRFIEDVDYRDYEPGLEEPIAR